MLLTPSFDVASPQNLLAGFWQGNEHFHLCSSKQRKHEHHCQPGEKEVFSSLSPLSQMATPGALLLEHHTTSHNAIRLLHSSPRKAPGGAASRICRQPVPRQSPHCSGSKPHAPASLCSLQPSRHEGRRGNLEKILTMMILLTVMMIVTIKLST